MTETTASDAEALAASFRRINAETDKFIAKQRKLMAEDGKLQAERASAVVLAPMGDNPRTHDAAVKVVG